MEEKHLKQNKNLTLENTYETLPELLFSRQKPSQVPHPQLVIFNDLLAQSLGLNETFFKSNEGIGILSGNKVLEGTTPIAQAYAGHQFGYFTMLGDGRAVLLGEYITKDGERIDVQLKGSGRTPYSRRGDGKAALGPMLREYIISEGMYALGIPTTRSLAVIKTGESILRETPLEGAILTRLATSYIRVGTFQYVAKWGKVEDLKALADYTLKRHFGGGAKEDNPYLYLLHEVVRRQAQLVAKWQLVGFIHGVMNTDNMAISGETIDYGPCAFMDTYDPHTVFSSIDTEGRYAYGNQPQMAGWNLARFAETLIPLLHEHQEEAVKLANKEISGFGKLFKQEWHMGMKAKLGLFNDEEMDSSLIEALLEIMQTYQADFTNTFYSLTLGKLEENRLFNSEDFKKWHLLWQQRLDRQGKSKEEIAELMKENNPAVIPRNHKVEEALEAATKDNNYEVLHNLLQVITNPYDYTKKHEGYMTLPKHVGCYKTYCGT